MKLIIYETWTGNKYNGHWYTKKKKFDELILNIIQDNCKNRPNYYKNVRVEESTASKQEVKE